MSTIKKAGSVPLPPPVIQKKDPPKATIKTASTTSNAENLEMSRRASEQMAAQRQERAANQTPPQFVRDQANTLAVMKNISGPENGLAKTPDESSSLDRDLRTIQNGVETLHDLRHAAIDGTQNLADRAQELRNTGIDNAQVLADQAHDLGDAAVDNAQDLANRAHSGLNSWVDSAQEYLPDSVNQSIDQAQELANTAHRGADALVDGGQAIQRGAHDLTNRAIDTGQAIDRGVHDIADRVIDTGQAIDHRVHDLINQGIDSVRDASNVSLEDRIASGLNSPGDKLTLGMGVSVSVEGAKVATKGSMEISQTADTPPRYTVAISGEAAGGIAGELGVQLGGQASVSGELLGRAGGKVEMTFDSPADVARAADIIRRQSSSNYAGPMPGVGPVLGQTSRTNARPSLEEIQFLHNSLSAFEVRGGAVGELSGGLGLQLDETLKVGGLSSKSNISQDFIARFEMPQRDASGNVTRGARVTFQSETAGSLSNSAGLGVGDPSQDRGASLSRSVGGGGNLSGKLTLSRTYELPQDVTAQNLLNDPIGTLQSASNGVEEVDRSATLTLSAQGGVTGASGSGQGQYTGGREVQLKIGANPSQIVQSGFGEQLFNGDFQGAARSLGDGVTFEAKSESITTTGFQVAPDFTAMGYGVGFEAQATREDRTTLTEEKVTGSQMAEYIQQSLTN